MRILITGASGLIGRELEKAFRGKGWEMLLATRSEISRPEQIRWDVENGFADNDLERLENLDAVIHLAGENIAGLRWTDEKKRAIRDSRVFGTRNMVETFARLTNKPKVFASSSATGFYGDRGDEIVDEQSGAGETFLAETCRDWEAESRRAEELGIRTVLVRTGIVLAKDGGALATMLTPFKFGVGGVVGSGKQWMSWIALDDIVGVYILAIENENMSGAVNGVSPNPVTNDEFTRTLGSVIGRPTILPLPEFAVKLMFGEMGDALLLASTRVEPKRLESAGFKFEFPELKAAIAEAVR